MQFVIYCGELRASGGRSVGVGLLQALAQMPLPHSITAYVPPEPAYEAAAGGPVRLVTARAPGGVLRLTDHYRLRRELEADPPDAVLMMGNLALVRPPCPQAVYIHNPWLLYPESVAWRRCSPRERIYRRLRNRAIARGLPYCQAVVSQTPVMLERLRRLFGVPEERLVLIPNSVTAAPAGAEETESSRRMRATPHRVRALCLARYITHKNLEVLLEVADRLVQAGRTDTGLFITVDPAHGSGARRLLAERMRRGRDRVLHNLGEIPMSHVASCYQAADALLLPTLMESFSGTYADAMRFGVPIITSDLDFAHVVCGGAAWYVDPTDADGIVAALDSLQTDAAGWQRRVALGKERADALLFGWDEIAARVITVLECLARGERAALGPCGVWQADVAPAAGASADRGNA